MDKYINKINARDTEEDKPNHVNLRLPYVIAKGLGLSTEGMTPSEVWDMLNGYGLKPKEEYQKFWDNLEDKAKVEIEEKGDWELVNKVEEEKKELKPIDKVSEQEIIDEIVEKLTEEEKAEFVKEWGKKTYENKDINWDAYSAEVLATTFDVNYGDDKAFTDFVNSHWIDPKKLNKEEQTIESQQVETKNNDIDSPFGEQAYTEERKANAINTPDPKVYDQMARVPTFKTWQKLSKVQKECVVDYTGGYSKYNEPLRGIDYGTSAFLGVGNVDMENIGVKYKGLKKGEVKEKIDNLTSAIEQCSYDKDCILRRGCNFFGMDKFFQGVTIDELQYSSTEELSKKLVGNTYIDHGFTSCGSSKGKGFSKPVKFSIYAPKGTKMMYFEPVSKFGNGAGIDWQGQEQTSFSYENETVIQRGTSYRVTEVKRINGGLYVRMEVVAQQKF